MTDQEMLEAVKVFSGGDEVYRVHRFLVYRRRPDGATKAVTVDIRDEGEDAYARWHPHVEDEDGRHARANPDRDLRVALSGVHWTELDRD